MTGVEFDLVDARDGEAGVGAEFGGCCGGDDAGFGEGIGGGEFDAQPVAVFAVFRPDDGHLRTGVASDQRELLHSIGTRLVYRVMEAICEVVELSGGAERRQNESLPSVQCRSTIELNEILQ